MYLLPRKFHVMKGLLFTVAGPLYGFLVHLKLPSATPEENAPDCQSSFQSRQGAEKNYCSHRSRIGHCPTLGNVSKVERMLTL